MFACLNPSAVVKVFSPSDSVVPRSVVVVTAALRMLLRSVGRSWDIEGSTCRLSELIGWIWDMILCQSQPAGECPMNLKKSSAAVNARFESSPPVPVAGAGVGAT